MTRPNQTTLALSSAARTMARMAAAREDITFAECIEQLVKEGARRTGIASLASDDDRAQETDDAR